MTVTNDGVNAQHKRTITGILCDYVCPGTSYSLAQVEGLKAEHVLKIQ